MRFIPAGAGNTSCCQVPRRFSPVHPRGCGEHAIASNLRQSGYGSSPRVRGTRFHPPFPREPAAVHPRGCGEHSGMSATETKSAGSSPRVRGTRLAGPSSSIRMRFIPAGAGNTCKAASALGRGPVHPRGCGEHAAMERSEKITDGSSPRVRGTHVSKPLGIVLQRFIPAGAGNTPPALPGEPAVLGSSPRVRGTHHPGPSCPG